MVTLDRLQRIAEGREAEIFAWDDGRVLRLFRGARSAESLEREATAMRAARAVVPLVPEAFEIVDVDGRPGIVLERVDGVDLITVLGKKPWMVWSAGSTCGRVHAQLHDVVAPPSLESLHDRIRRLCATSDAIPPDVVRNTLARLETLPDGDRLCHGDFHPGNVLMSPRGPVVIDWPNVTRGDAAADHARTTLLLRIGDPPPGSPALVKYMEGFGRKIIARAYKRAYLRARPTDASLAKRWELVRAADRLAENISEEREKLLTLLRENRR